MTQALETVFASADEASASPISLSAVAAGQQAEIEGLDAQERGWVAANNFRGVAGSTLCLPAADGGIARALVGIGAPDDGDPSGSALLHLGRAPSSLPKGVYTFDPSVEDTETAAIAWGLGGYQFQRFKSKSAKRARLVVPDAVGSRVRAIVAAVHRGRDLINTPANALGPSELADAVVELGEQHGARVKIRKGEDVGFAEEFPLLHAVGRASTRPSRLCDLTWGDPQAPKITLVGKGIIFDTGGLDLKPAAAMLLMKKDMGGAASAIATAQMIMALNLPVRLRLLIAAAENAVAGDAFRPGDVIASRGGPTVEIGNTDAEGRLVLADALSLADEEAPDVMISFATLTGAARVALGADLPAMFSTDNELADHIGRAGLPIGDPVWRMPFWPGYERLLKSSTADTSNVSEGPFAGAITAALFLKKFVSQTQRYAHFDMYGWRQAQRALGPKGGEVHTARAVLASIEAMTTRTGSQA